MYVIYGAGKIGRQTLQRYGSENIAYYIDNQKSGTIIDQKEVISFEQYLKLDQQHKCIVAIGNYEPIVNELEHHHINDYILSSIIEEVMPPMSKDISHGNWINVLVSLCDKPGMRVLEIGSRNVTGVVFRDKFKHAEYIGFDYYPGDNVDVVGDAHKLLSYFDEQDKFDLIFSSAVFEHLAMPWMITPQIAKLLKVGGYVFTETHFCHSCHERPWHFFHYTDNGLQVLFPSVMGIETIEKGFSNPIDAKHAGNASAYLAGKTIPAMFTHVEFLGQKVKEVENFSWDQVDVAALLEGKKYPQKID